jgi:hypothetical protein
VQANDKTLHDLLGEEFQVAAKAANVLTFERR